jgi:hypothetical protein
METRRVEPSAAECAVLASMKMSRSEPYDVHMLTPTYLRRSDAEEKKR